MEPGEDLRNRLALPPMGKLAGHGAGRGVL